MKTQACPVCHLNAWAKPAARLMCGECETLMQVPADEEGEAERRERTGGRPKASAPKPAFHRTGQSRAGVS